MAKRKGPPKRPPRRGKVDGPWKPNPVQLEWYRQWTCESKGVTTIANGSTPKVSRVTVHQAVHKVAEWYRHLCHHEIMSFRDRQTHIFEQMIQEAWQAWRDSIGEVIVTTVKDGDKKSTETKTSTSQGDPAYLAQVVSACQEIQKLWGFNAPSKQQIDVGRREDIPGFPYGGGFGSRVVAFEHAMRVLEEGRARAMRMEERESGESSN